MGKIAEQGVQYCNSNSTAAISVGNKIFSTEVPPISYSLDGQEVVIYDGDEQEIGRTDLPSGSLRKGEPQEAIADTDYCGSSPKAELSWSSGSISTTSPPIRYQVSSTPTDIIVDGQAVGATQALDAVAPYSISTDVVSGQCPGIIYDVGCGYRWILPGQFIRRFDFLSPSSANFIGPITEAKVVTLDPNGNEITTGGGTLNRIGLRVVSDGGNNTSFFQFQQGTNIYVYEVLYVSIYPRTPEPPECSGEICTLSINYADGTIFEYGEIPCDAEISTESTNTVTVFDSSGTLFEEEYGDEPTGFTVACFTPDTKEVTYACLGECPSGAEWQCRCRETNTLMCYGYNPNNPNVFKPLHITHIVG